MSAFKKAMPQQAKLKLSLYGPPGSGKTFTSLLIAEGLAKAEGKRVAFIDTERGTDFYALKAPRPVHPEPFDFDALYTRSLLEVIESVQSLDPETHGVIVIDSITHLWDAAIAAYEGRKTKIDSIPMHAWGAIKKPFKGLIRWLMDAPFHVLILGRQKSIFETDPTDADRIRKVGVGMRTEGETEYEPHICARMEARRNEMDSTHSTPFVMFEKDRTGVLSGRTVPNPSFATVEPILSLLASTTQGSYEDPDETAAKDSELLDRQEDKANAKAEKSLSLFRELNAEIMTTDDMATLGRIAEKIKKQKRYLLEEHVAALRPLYEMQRDKVAGAAAPKEV